MKNRNLKKVIIKVLQKLSNEFGMIKLNFRNEFTVRQVITEDSFINFLFFLIELLK